ncbi:chromosome partitioning ATPase [Natrinema pellirubrum DSM 15624]|uniref:Iron-sulfur cluster carrier protein n=1 Tax=Natrinema pellirubrum (strain DSM 15624 / CIP 106293 / JCM 10476 / NCIMB 786 / 157) TaxID=797303 RepID=L0JNV2_NATP1|nr:P-loop NTPase [Natrinema pellirubrum]AGB32277.1 ATPase involved in chromosome partitioning [Natrinema pellirubrum DSM 15624]ELY74641.1 chromosome partitioning ATPase [Natrinema pellirubrum DSM 15624]
MAKDDIVPDEVPTDDLAARVREGLRAVDDPDLGTDVLESGLVTDVSAEGGAVRIAADLAGFDEPTAEDVTEAMRRRALSTPGVERATVEGEPTGAADDDIDGAAGVDTVIAVASAKGGVGKTTVSTQLARALAADPDRDVGIFDADLYGPNVPELLDLEGPVSANADGDAEPIEAGDLTAMSVGLIANDEPLAWRGAMAHEAVSELFEDTAWGELDTLVVDLPPGTGDIVLTALQSLPIDGAVLVSTPHPTSVGDTSRSATLFEENGVPLLGTVVNMRGFSCECGREHDLFPEADVEAALDQPVLCDFPFDERVREFDDDVPPEACELAAAVDERLEAVGDLSVPDHALDLRGLPKRIRHEQATEEFRATEPGETFYLINDHDPSPLANELVSAVDREGAPGDAFAEYQVRRQAPDEWVMAVAR